MQGILNRLKHWKSSLAGVGVMVVVGYLFSSFGCKLPADWMGWVVTVVAGLPGVLSKG